MSMLFPNSPSVGDLGPVPPISGGPVYRWDGEKWTTQGVGGSKTPVYTDGSTAMTAQLTLIAPPVNPTDAAAKSYVDGKTTIATSAEYVANATNTKMLSPNTVWGAVVSKGAYSGASMTLDMSSFIDFFINPGVGSTMNNPTAGTVGQRGIIYIQQNAGGNATITTWGSKWKFPGGTKPVLSTGSLVVDALSYIIVDGASIYGILNNDFK